MGPTRTRYTYGSACAYRMTTACSGAVARPVIGTADQARSNLVWAVGRTSREIHPCHLFARPYFGDRSTARGNR